jgi:exodeoxyribonuclease-1
MSSSELLKLWRKKPDDDSWTPFPVSSLQFNRCPAVAPLSVLDKDSQKRLGLDMKVIASHFQSLQQSADLIAKLEQAQELLNKQKQIEWTSDEQSVDEQLYDGFFDRPDKQLIEAVHQASPDKLSDFIFKLGDPRLKALLPLYKARNYQAYLNTQERSAWETFCEQRLLSGKDQSRLAGYMQRIDELAAKPETSQQSYLLEELRLYGQSIMPG